MNQFLPKGALMEFIISHRIEQNICIITIRGHLALNHADEAKAYAVPLINEPNVQGVIFNCEDMSNIDSNGIAYLVYTLKKLKDLSKSFSLCRLNSKTQKILAMLGLDRLLEIHETEDDALSSVAKGES